MQLHYLDVNKLVHGQYTSKPFILIRTAEQTVRMTYLLGKLYVLVHTYDVAHLLIWLCMVP